MIGSLRLSVPAVTGLALRRSTAIGHPRGFRHRASRVSTRADASGWRPDPRDIVRLSRGEKALTRGTGSRDVPHRLNAEEAKQFEIAQRRKFVVLRGDGHRRERKGSPLCNTWRQWADCFSWPCVQVRQGKGGSDLDTVVVDLSTLRAQDDSDIRSSAKLEAERLQCKLIREDLPVGSVDIFEAGHVPSTEGLPSEDDLERARAAIDCQGQVVKDIKDKLREQQVDQDGTSINQHEDVKAAVLVLKQLKARLIIMEEELEEYWSRRDEAAEAAEAEKECEGPIWTLRPVELHFEAIDRPAARAFAEALAASHCPTRSKIKV